MRRDLVFDEGLFLGFGWDDLPTGEQLHLAGILVDVSVTAADWAVLWGLLAVYWTVLSVCTYVVARTQMGQRYSHSKKIFLRTCQYVFTIHITK